ncbi:cytidine deaminase-like protein [Cladochytrium replicatum]|nr:cytidine deaminase-like protein [Cladochytrium replicatum]
MAHSSIAPDQLTEILSTGVLPEAVKLELTRLCHFAKQHSYSPYSKFRVGAALLTKTGKIYLGVNVENASYGGTICAERTAFVKAVSDGEKQFLAVAVGTDVDECVAPCGMCRQFMVEFGKKIQVLETTERGKIEILTLEQLLPGSFGPDDLEKPRG